MSEVTLPGGNTTGAVLIDGVVHKRASPWTATVHAVLRHLEDAGFDAAPRALGFDDQGREMLSYLPGETIGDREPWPGWASADSMLVQVGQWLRRVHDLTAGFPPPPDECWFIGGTMGPGLIVGHQDAAPYNAVVDGDRLVGFCDWDIAGPSSPDWDLAFSALTWVPLASPRDGTPSAGHDLRGAVPPPSSSAGRVRLRRRPAGVRVVVPRRARRQAGVIRQHGRRRGPGVDRAAAHRGSSRAVRDRRPGPSGRLLGASIEIRCRSMTGQRNSLR